MDICDMVKTLLYNCFKESSIHGFPLIVKKQRLFIERLFWILCILFCITFTTSICYGQWSRFINNPIVLSLETNYRNWKLGLPGITICSNYTDRRMARTIVERTWNITPNDSKFEYYERFILTVASAKFYNLQEFIDFAENESLNNVDMLQEAYEMRQEIHTPPSPEYSNVITEMGICHTTSELVNIQKPYRGISVNISNFSIPENILYTSVDVMRLIITPHYLDTENVTIYIHNKYDVINGADTIHESLIGSMDIIHNQLEVQEILTADSLRDFSIQRRKCLFSDEPVLKYFPVYTKNLCRINCRIQAALLSCGCYPFFYNLNSSEPTCNATGLYCLSKTDWYSKKCKCYPLCDTTTYIQMSSEKIFYSYYSRFLQISVIYPKSRIKRRVVFSIYEVIVSFGGGAVFFLGCSFLSSVEIGFHICEWFCCLIFKCIRRPSQLNVNN